MGIQSSTEPEPSTTVVQIGQGVAFPRQPFFDRGLPLFDTLLQIASPCSFSARPVGRVVWEGLQGVIKAGDASQHAVGGDSHDAADEMVEVVIRGDVVETTNVVGALGEGGDDEGAGAEPLHVDAGEPVRGDVDVQMVVVVEQGLGDKGAVVE